MSVPVLYASATWGVHDWRWVSALESCGFAVESFVGTDNAAAVAAAEPAHAPVLAGPLTTVARYLLGSNRPVVGLSWGFDLQQGHAGSTHPRELSWLRDLDRLIVDSPSSAEIAMSAGLSADRVHLLPWGIDIEQFPVDGPRERSGLPEDARVITSMRRHDPIYRTSDVIEAFGVAAALNSRLFLVMGGSGSLTDQHRARITELGLEDRVRFIGEIPEAEVAAVLRGSDCYVTASETDGTSVTLLQAMACRTPVVASDIAGNNWWIDDRVTGRTFPVGDIALLAELMVNDGHNPAWLDRARGAVVSRADWLRNRADLRSIMNFSATS